MKPINVIFGAGKTDFVMHITEGKKTLFMDKFPDSQLAEALQSPWLFSKVEPNTDVIVFSDIKNSQLQLVVHATMAEPMIVNPKGKPIYRRHRPDVIVLLDDGLDLSKHIPAVIRRIQAIDIQ